MHQQIAACPPFSPSPGGELLSPLSPQTRPSPLPNKKNHRLSAPPLPSCIPPSAAGGSERGDPGRRREGETPLDTGGSPRSITAHPQPPHPHTHHPPEGRGGRGRASPAPRGAGRRRRRRMKDAGRGGWRRCPPSRARSEPSRAEPSP